jgi:probable rRNA maturation factor
MQRLNLQFRRKDKPTDVLSFPAAQPPEAGDQRQRPEGHPLAHTRCQAGDIAISIQTARAQAAEIGHDLLTEVKVLILHGMLHLAGHDHEIDRGQMSRLEQKLRTELNLPAGLIERVAPSQSAARTITRRPAARIGRRP